MTSYQLKNQSENQPKIVLTEQDVRIEFVRASGAGGQNVNKSNTAAQIYFHVPSSSKLTNEQKTLLLCEDCDTTNNTLRIVWNRLNSNGDIVIKSMPERTQERNKEAGMKVLNQLLNGALFQDKPRETEMPKKLKAKIKARVMEAKSRQYKRERTNYV